MAWLYSLKIQNQLGGKRRKRKSNTVGLCNLTCCDILILIWKYNRPACFANQACPLKYAAQKCVWKDIPTYWNWFNEVFYPEVRKRTCHPVFFAHGSGNFETFQSENVMVAFFRPNVTSWKQSCNLGFISAVK